MPIRWLLNKGWLVVLPRIQGYMGSSNSEVLVRSTEQTNVGKIFVAELHSRKIFSYVFCVRKYLYNANCGI